MWWEFSYVLGFNNESFKVSVWEFGYFSLCGTYLRNIFGSKCACIWDVCLEHCWNYSWNVVLRFWNHFSQRIFMISCIIWYHCWDIWTGSVVHKKGKQQFVRESTLCLCSWFDKRVLIYHDHHHHHHLSNLWHGRCNRSEAPAISVLIAPGISAWPAVLFNVQKKLSACKCFLWDDDGNNVWIRCWHWWTCCWWGFNELWIRVFSAGNSVVFLMMMSLFVMIIKRRMMMMILMMIIMMVCEINTKQQNTNC